jgi:hypothetical protein
MWWRSSNSTIKNHDSCISSSVHLACRWWRIPSRHFRPTSKPIRPSSNPNQIPHEKPQVICSFSDGGVWTLLESLDADTTRTPFSSRSARPPARRLCFAEIAVCGIWVTVLHSSPGLPPETTIVGAGVDFSNRDVFVMGQCTSAGARPVSRIATSSTDDPGARQTMVILAK